MFLFLSKLIPLFFYPLGLTCLLLGVAIATLWKRPQWTARVLVAALTLLLLSGNPIVADSLVRSLEYQYPSLEAPPTSDAIVILGGGVRSPASPRPWVEVAEGGDRVLYGAKLYREGRSPWVILSGGRIPWLGAKKPESDDMATLIQVLGVPASALLTEPDSLNTHENVVNVKRILQDNNLTGDILLVTSAMHMPRAMAIFKKQGIDAIAAPTDFLTIAHPPALTGIAIFIRILPQTRSLDRTTLVLKEYLGLLVYRLRGWL